MILFILATACALPDFTQEWLVDRTRVLAIQAEPPEAASGQLVTLSALVVDPNGEPEAAWVACTMPVDCPDFEAVQSLAAADTSAMSAEELAAWQADAAAAGFLGFGAGLSPTLVVSGVGAPPGDTGIPDTGLRDTADTASTDSGSVSMGSELVLIVDALPVGKALGDVTLGDPKATEVASKGLTVSDSATPNQNPGVASLTVDGDDAATVSRGSSASLKATLTDGSAESYLDEDGETQTEEPTVSYYVAAGSLMQSSAAADEPEVSWTAPESAGTVNVWVVVRDGRGGMSWASATVMVE